MDIKLIPSLLPAYEKLKKAVRSDLVFITGPPSTGKSTMTKKLFQDYKGEYLHAYIDCYSISSQSKLLSLVCQAYYSTMNVRRGRAQITGVRLPEPGEPVSMSDFPHYMSEFRTIAEEKGYKRIFIVLDQVEVFERTNMMDTLIALCRFNALGLRLIMISGEDPNDFVTRIEVKSTSIALSVQDRIQVILCHVWSKDDIIEWILCEQPKSETEIYSKFVRNIVVLVYTRESRDPRQIRMYCQEHFEDFIKFYKPKKRDLVMRQLKLNPGELTDAELDEHELVSTVSASLVANFLQDYKVRISRDRDNSKWTHKDSETKMTVNSAILIVAAYIAAYTKSADDKANFIRYQRGKKINVRSRSSQVVQNKPFTMERLVQIYIRLMRKATGIQKLHIIYNNDHVLSDLERFENLNIIQHVSGSELSSDARYKLSHCIKKEYVQRLAKNNELDLEWYSGLPGTTG